MLSPRTFLLALSAGAAMTAALGALGAEDLRPHRPAPCMREIAVVQLLDEIATAAGAPSRTHEGRRDLLLHIRDRIDAELSQPTESCNG